MDNSSVKRISVTDVTKSALPLNQSPVLIQNALKQCLANSYWSLNYFRRKLKSSENAVPVRRWYYLNNVLHSEASSLPFDNFVENLSLDTPNLHIKDTCDLGKAQGGYYFSESTSDPLFLASGISETYPWPYNASGGITTIEIFSPYIVHPLRYDERFSNIISVIKGKLKVTLIPMVEENLELLKPYSVYGSCESSKIIPSTDLEHPDVVKEWNIFRFSQVSDVEQYLAEAQVKDVLEIEVNAGEMLFIPFNFWYQIKAQKSTSPSENPESAMCVRFRFQSPVFQMFVAPYFSYTIREVEYICQKLKYSNEEEKRDLVRVLIGDDSQKALIEYAARNPMEYLLDPQIQFVRRWVCDKMCASFCMTKLDQRVNDADTKVQQFILKMFVSDSTK